MALVHHELCFGCGRQNLFGLLLEAQDAGERTVTGRCFLKQDHQGPQRGYGHPGLLGCVLLEVMLLAAGDDVAAARVETELVLGAPAPVGAFCELTASTADVDAEHLHAEATATVEGRVVARARAQLVRRGPGP